MIDNSKIIGLKRQVVSRIARLFECAHLMDLNRGDGDFKAPIQRGASLEPEERGQIFYVVDTNFIKAFLRPTRWFRYSRLFHDWLWSPLRVEEKIYDRLIVSLGAQSTLLATEFVLSNELKGAAGRVYMSGAHYSELVKQLEFFVDETKDSLGSMSSTLPDIERKIVSLAKLSTIDRAQAQDFIERDELFIPYDKRKLRSLNDSQFDQFRDDYIVAAVCRLLAEDDVIEPIEQLNRLGREEVWDGIFPIEWEFPVETPAEQEDLTEEEGRWLKRLKAEVGIRERRRLAREQIDPAPKNARRKQQKRGGRSIEADAKTLAYLVWATRKRAGPRQRIVFVTGDRLILDAYRRWHAYHGHSYTFLVRPLAQFTPQHNLRDAGSPLSKELEIFTRTRQAVEASTFPLAIGLKSHYFAGDPTRYARTATERARNRFCAEEPELPVDDAVMDIVLGAFSDNEARLKLKADELDSLADKLRWSERLAVGAIPQLVRRRVQDAIDRAANLTEIFDRAERQGSDIDSVIAEWVAEKLTEATSNAFKFSIPLAADHILGLQVRQDGPGLRIPAALRIRFPIDGTSVSAAEWLALSNTKKKRIGALRRLSEQPALIFALASWLAFHHELWSDAVRFADFAAQAAEHYLSEAGDDASAGIGLDHPSAVFYECQYLKALALRIRMASEEPTDKYDADVWRRDLHGAEQALSLCIDHHQGTGRVRWLRALSERSAVRLTYCAWAAVGKLGMIKPYQREWIELTTIMEGAIRDLKMVAEALPVTRANIEHTPDQFDHYTRTAALDWVDRQAAINPECARIVYERLQGIEDPVWHRAYVGRLQGVERDLDEIGFSRKSIAIGDSDHEIFKAYVLSARHRMGKQFDRKEVDILSTGNVSLALDRAMLSTIRTRLLTA